MMYVPSFGHLAVIAANKARKNLNVVIDDEIDHTETTSKRSIGQWGYGSSLVCGNLCCARIENIGKSKK